MPRVALCARVTRMKYLMSLLAALLMTSLACSPVANAGVDTDKLMSGVLRAGARALQTAKNRPAAEESSSVEQTAVGEPHAEEGRVREKLGREMLAAFLDGTAEGIGEQQPMSQWLSSSMKQALDILLEEYKEQYKEEGRLYAREIGDKLVYRLREDPKIRTSLLSLQALCWGVVVYLTIVTLVMLVALLRMKRTQTQLLAAIEELKQRH